MLFLMLLLSLEHGLAADGSAFETIFGHGEDSRGRKDEEKKDGNKSDAKADSKDNESDDDVEEKKTA